MKKILSLFILFLSVGLFAETGYAGVEWGTKKEQLKDFFIEHDNSELWDNIEVREKQILNEKTKVYYHFNKGLVGVSYAIPDNRTSVILKKYSDLVDTLFSISVPVEEFKNDLKNKLDLENINNLNLAMNLTIFTAVTRQETTSEIFFTKPLYGENGFVYIFNYNDDTNVYVIQNFFKGYTFVVYVVREQDY